nr:transcription-repair coupling factor [Arenimonas sp.]
MNASFLIPAAKPKQLITALQALPGNAALAYTIIDAARQSKQLQLVITHDSFSAQQLEQDLRALKSDLAILHFPDWETLCYDQFSPHPDLISQRIDCLFNLPRTEQGILIVPITSLMQRITPTDWIAGHVLDLRIGQKFDLSHERLQLQRFGYRHVPQVMDCGDFSIRGAILDLFPSGSKMPLRIELMDDEIDSLRMFDPDTQRSEASQSHFKLLPAREFPLDTPSCKFAREQLLERFDIDPRTCGLYADLKEGVAPAGIEYYLPLFFDKTSNLLDYLPEHFHLFITAKVLDAAEQFWQQTAERYEQRRHDRDRPILPPHELFFSPEQMRARFNLHHRYEFIDKDHAGYAKANAIGISTAFNCFWQDKTAQPESALLEFVNNYPGEIILVADSPGRREALKELFKHTELM